ncbi:MAG: GntR family transcriptional regulator [Chloroflexota bacterium]
MNRYQIEAIRESAAGQRLAQRQPLPGSVYEIVTDMLMTHAFEPGARLNIEELARALRVSPTPVREALARVEADGLIVKQPGRSYTVAPLMGIEQVRELIELRLLVEPAVAAKAAAHAGPDEIKELRRAARAGGAGGEITAAANRLDMVYDATFHAMLADLAGNQMISDMLTRLRSHLHTFRLYYHARLHSVTKSEHLAVVDAVARHDPDEAAEAMRLHLVSALERLETFVDGGSANAEAGLIPKVTAGRVKE